MIDEVENPGSEKFSPAKRIGEVMARYMSQHQDFYLFSPDETTSNKLDAVYEVSERAWDLPTHHWDLPESAKGQIIELLSENTLFACMAGHLLAGGTAMMTSYESFFMIIASQLIQHLKFLQQSATTKWRPAIPAANLLSTSTCWRQDHNGFTHQSPALISLLLSHPSQHANCLFPLDDVAAESAFIFMTEAKNVVNLTTFNKTDQPRWLNSHQADMQYSQGGASILEFISDENPDYVLVGVGDITTHEIIAAKKILSTDLPELHFRVINILALSYQQIGTTNHPLNKTQFAELFTKACPIIANFHGYPEALHEILSQYAQSKRLSVHGFREQGSTTTPFEMLSLNHASRYDIAIDVAKQAGHEELVKKYGKILADNRAYAKKHGVDLPELSSL